MLTSDKVELVVGGQGWGTHEHRRPPQRQPPQQRCLVEVTMGHGFSLSHGLIWICF